MKNEMSRRQFLGFAGSAAAVLGLGLVGCGGSAGSGSSASGDAAEVYFLQFKPEVDKEWKEIAKAYKKEKGVEVKIVTAASNTYVALQAWKSSWLRSGQQRMPEALRRNSRL